MTDTPESPAAIRRRLLANKPKPISPAKPAKESSRALWSRVTAKINAKAEPAGKATPTSHAKPTPANVQAAFARGIKQGQRDTDRPTP